MSSTNNNNTNARISELIQGNYIAHQENRVSIIELLQFLNLEDNNSNKRKIGEVCRSLGFKQCLTLGTRKKAFFIIKNEEQEQEEQEQEQEQKEEQKEENKNILHIKPYTFYKNENEINYTNYFYIRNLSLYPHKIILSLSKSGIKYKAGYLKLIGFISNPKLNYIEPFLNKDDIKELPKILKCYVMSEEEILNHDLYSFENNKVFLNLVEKENYEKGFFERLEEDNKKFAEDLKQKHFYIKQKEKEDIIDYLERYDREIGEVLKRMREKEEKTQIEREIKHKEFLRNQEIEKQKREEDFKNADFAYNKYMDDLKEREKLIKSINSKNTSCDMLYTIADKNNISLGSLGLRPSKNELIQYILNNLQEIKFTY